jgi:hypothetical protein
MRQAVGTHFPRPVSRANSAPGPLQLVTVARRSPRKSNLLQPGGQTREQITGSGNDGIVDAEWSDGACPDNFTAEH